LKYQNFPEDAKDLICSLLQPNPLNRLGSGSKGPLNNYSVLKNHPFFEGIDFDMIPFISPPGLNNLKEVMRSAKSMKMITAEQKKKTTENSTNEKSKENDNFFNSVNKYQSTDNSLNLHLDSVVRVIKQGILKKKSPWFHYNTRKVILDTTPKIEYLDPVSGVVKVIGLKLN